MAFKYGKTPAQVILRWHIQHGFNSDAFGLRNQIPPDQTEKAVATALEVGYCHIGTVWQTSRWARSTTGPAGRWLRALLRVHRRRDQPVRPGDRPGHRAGGARPDPEEGYHFTEDMTDQAIDWIGQQKAPTADKPFFMYFAPGATHAPTRPTEWSDRYKGRFDRGWDQLREATFARQKELASSPDAELTARPAEIPRPGTTGPRTSSRCWPARWRSTPGSWPTPTTTSAG